MVILERSFALSCFIHERAWSHASLSVLTVSLVRFHADCMTQVMWLNKPPEDGTGVLKHVGVAIS
jgi:hypothetical protein